MAIDYTKPVRKLQWRAREYEIATGNNVFHSSTYNNSFEIQRVAEDTKFFGQVICQKLNLKMKPHATIVYSTDYYWRLTIAEEVDGQYTFENFTCPFYTTEVHTDENTGIKSITAYDWIKLTEELTFSELNLNPPYTIRQVAEAIPRHYWSGRQTHFINIEEDLLNLNYPNGANLNGNEKCVDILSQIAEVLGAVCYIDIENSLVFKRLDKDGEPVATITKADYFKLKSGDNKRLSKIIYATELEDNIEAHITETGSTQAVTNNAFLDNRYDREQLIQNAINAYGGLTIGTFDMTWRGNPNLQIGDKIAITAKDDTAITTYLLDETLTWNNGLQGKMQFKWDGSKEPDAEANPSTIGEAIYQTYAKVDKINKQIDLVVADVETNTQTISGVKNDLTATKTQVTTNKNDIAALTLTTSGITANVENLSSRVENTETQMANLAIGGRNLFIAKTRTNNTSYTTTSSWKQSVLSDYIPVELGETYIIQVWKPANEEATGYDRGYTTIALFDENKGYISYTVKPETATNYFTGSYFSYPYKIKDETVKYIRAFFHFGVDGTSGVNWNPYGEFKIKLERGTLPTEWSIAPEDVEGAIANVESTASGIRADLTTTQTQVATNKTDIANLSVTTEGITANVQNLETKTTNTNNKVATLEGNLDSLEGTVEETNEQVNTNKENIASLQVTTQGISASVSNLETSQETLTNTVSNLAVGGRNLVIASTRTNNSYIDASGSVAAWTKTILTDFISIEEEETYIIQFWQKPAPGATGDNRIHYAICYFDADKQYLTRYTAYTSENDYVKYKFTIPKNSGRAYVRIYYHFGINGTQGKDWNPYGDFKIKYEKGNLPTEWSIAPEDIQNGLIDVNAIANGIRTDLTTTQTQVETNKQNIASLEVTTQGITANVENLDSRTETLTTTVSSMAVGGRNLFIAKDRINDRYVNADGVIASWANSVTSDYIPLKQGSTYILQIWQPPNTTATGTDRSYWSITVFDADKNRKALLKGAYFTNDYQKYSYKVTNEDYHYVRILYHFGSVHGSGTQWNPYGQYRIKYEEGTLPTGWSIAPEDIDNGITNAQSTADGVRTDLTTTQSQVETNRQNIANLSVTTEGISADVESLDSRTETLTTKVSTVESTANTAKSTADTAKSTADTAKTTATTAKNTADTAKSTADTAKSTADTAKTTATTAKNTADTAKSTADTAKSTADGVRTDLTTTQTQVTTNKNDIANLKVTTEGISASVSSLDTRTETVTTTVNNLAVGGRNLFIASTRTNDKYVKTDSTLSEWQNAVMSDYIPLEADKTYIMQTWQPANTSATGTDRSYLIGYLFDENKSRTGATSGGYYTTDYYKATFKNTNGTYKYMRVLYHIGSVHGSGVNWNPYGSYKVKCECGTLPTAWSIAPEDLDADITTAQTNASSAVTTANTANTNASNAVSTANTAKSTADTAKSTADTAKTTATTAKNTADTAKSTADSAKTTATTAKSTADTAKSTADGVRADLTTTQTQVQTNKEQIASLNTSKEQITASVSSLETTTETITTRIDTNGNRNLFVACTRENDIYPKSSGYATWLRGVLSDFIPVEPGDSFTMQAWLPAVSTDTETARPNLTCYGFDADKNYVGYVAGGYFTAKYYKSTFTLSSTATTRYYRFCFHFGVSSALLGADWEPTGDYKVKVEVGKTATDWSLAPEDVVENVVVLRNDINQTRSEFTLTNNSINAKVDSVTNDAKAVQSALDAYKASNNSKIDDIEGSVATVRSATETIQSDQAYQASVIEELKNSQGKATSVTTTTATLNNSGLTVSKSSSALTTTISENGMTVKNGSETELTANDQGVIAHNLTADNYLIVDGIIRWQKYGSNRIGCYWIGG